MKLTEYKQTLKKPTKSKYSNRRTILDGITFDSKREADYYRELKLRERLGEVVTIELQPKYELIPSYPHPVTGKKIQPAYYKADFKVTYTDGREEVIDVKGVKTAEYKLKKKMFEYRYQIEIREVS